MRTSLGTGNLSPTWLFVFALRTQAFKDLQSDVIRSISERMGLPFCLRDSASQRSDTDHDECWRKHVNCWRIKSFQCELHGNRMVRASGPQPFIAASSR